jgi:hypothetical protein
MIKLAKTPILPNSFFWYKSALGKKETLIKFLSA